MLKDRAQKATALKFCVSKRWLPQLEVEIEPSNRLEQSRFLLTDLDVLAITTSPVGMHSKLVFDCKSGIRESAIGRAFWLRGVMTKVGADHGFVILNSKLNLSRDHRASASELGVSLLHDTEFPDLAQGFQGSINLQPDYSLTSDIESWEIFLGLRSTSAPLAEYLGYATSAFWTIKDYGEQCRKTVARLRKLRPELDPSKTTHLAIFGDALCLFLISLSSLANRLFLLLMRPSVAEEFSAALLASVYGGYENLQSAKRIRQLATGLADDTVSIFPDVERFEQLVREVVQAPQQALPAALLAREVGFTYLRNAAETRLQVDIANESPYAPKFILLAAEYLQRSTKLPPEFAAAYADRMLHLMSKAMNKASL
ncbi:hypothetical protein NNO07_17035 [Pseudomonas resinovorans]|uniref:CD-NTase associated protein 4-like DNA endonuclease domain-containing protein n=1 Tax=Metapseudomonas resinovorans TaxID=53412 RepID=A0ABT4Y7C6_METRE|nr:hypothetical protein [Pseudomonas resinovorans]MDA8484775.1 hypothetical protein [Pseudomonas resinovorans]